MFPRKMAFYEVREFDLDNPDRTAPTDPLLFADVFDARIHIRDRLARNDLPTDIRQPSPQSVPLPPVDLAGTFYYPVNAYLYVDMGIPSLGQILIGYNLQIAPRTAPPERIKYVVNGALLRRLRQVFGYSMGDAAAVAGFNQKYLSQSWYNYESGIVQSVTEAVAEKLAFPFDIHPRQVLIGQPPALPYGLNPTRGTSYRPIADPFTVEGIRKGLNLPIPQPPRPAYDPYAPATIQLPPPSPPPAPPPIPPQTPAIAPAGPDTPATTISPDNATLAATWGA